MRANWTLVLLVPAAVALLATGVFPAWYPDLTTSAHVAMAVAGTILLIAAILAHELAHAVAARRAGVRVDAVTLWFLGGLTRFCGAVDRPRDEVRIATAGPVATLAVAAVAYGVALATGGVPQVQGVALWLAVVNAALAAFNLLPGFPLDGGRILRGVLWARSGDHGHATRVTARAGRAIGAGMVALAVLTFVAGAGADGLWLALVAWFVIGAAGAEEALGEAERTLGDERVAAVMRSDVTAVPAQAPLSLLLDRPGPAIPVAEDGRLTGLALRRTVEAAAGCAGLRAADVALPRGTFPEVGPDDRVAVVLETLAGEPRVAVVVQGDRPLGIVTLADVDRHLRPPAHHGPPPRRRHATTIGA
ncbi:MAG: site-2 protease family protein [Thermoleophilia bacterium]